MDQHPHPKPLANQQGRCDHEYIKSVESIPKRGASLGRNLFCFEHNLRKTIRTAVFEIDFMCITERALESTL